MTGLVISNWIQIIDFSALVTLKFDGWPRKKNRALLLYYIKLSASFQIHRWIQTGVTVRKPYHVKLSASFQIHWWIQTGVTVMKHSIRVKIGDVLSRVTLKLDGWPWKTIGHLFYTTLSFVHHFKAMGDFKLELQSGKTHFGKKSAFLLASVTLKLNGWHWKTIGQLFYSTLSFVHHFKAMGEFKLEWQSGNAQFELKPALFCPVWPWNLMNDIKKQ